MSRPNGRAGRFVAASSTWSLSNASLAAIWLGSAWRVIGRRGSISGVQFPPGLVEADRLPEPVFTPTTKAEVGHDEFMTMAEVGDLVGQETADDLERFTLAIYTRGAEIARERGVIIADTKFEFGRDADRDVDLGR